MAAAGERKTSIHNGIAFGYVTRTLTEALQQRPRKEAQLGLAFAELDDIFAGDYRNILLRKGNEVSGIGAELAELHRNHITAVVAFGDTFEYSRDLKKHVAASTVEIEEAQKDLGIRIFEDIARQFMVFHTTGQLVEEDLSTRVWKAAFGDVPIKDIHRHMIETRYEELTDEAGETHHMPVINRIWAVVPEKGKRRLDDYRRMMVDARRNDKGFLGKDAKMTLIVTADSDIAKISAEDLQEEGIEIIELPITTRQFYDFGGMMLRDNMPSADFATHRDILTYITLPHQLPPDALAAKRRHIAESSLRPDSVTAHPYFSGGPVSLEQRLQAAYPADIKESAENE